MPTKQARTSASTSKITRPASTKIAKFGIGTFGSARFGVSDGYTKQVRTSNSSTKISRPT